MARKERERRYIAEYCQQTWPEGGYILNVELGPIPQEYVDRYGLGKAAALFRPTRPRVDCVKWETDRYILIEAKVRDVKTGIGDLMYYRNMAKLAPDLPNYTGQPFVCLLIVPWMIDWIQHAATEADCEVIVFKPGWIDDYVKERQHYFTAEYREKRAEIMRLRKMLDLE